MLITSRNVRRFSLLAGLTCILAAGLSSVSRAQTWDLAADFTGASNPHGAWTYGYLTGSTFNTYTQETTDTYFQTPRWYLTNLLFIAKNNLSYLDYGISPGQITLSSDGGTPDARWTAPTTGLYNISAIIGGPTGFEVDGNGNANAHLAGLDVNGVLQSGVYNGGTNLYTWSLSNVHLNAGTTVDAFVGANLGAGNTNTVFRITEVGNTTPEPGSMALITGMLSITGIIAQRRRQLAQL